MGRHSVLAQVQRWRGRSRWQPVRTNIAAWAQRLIERYATLATRIATLPLFVVHRATKPGQIRNEFKSFTQHVHQYVRAPSQTTLREVTRREQLHIFNRVSDLGSTGITALAHRSSPAGQRVGPSRFDPLGSIARITPSHAGSRQIFLTSRSFRIQHSAEVMVKRRQFIDRVTRQAQRANHVSIAPVRLIAPISYRTQSAGTTTEPDSAIVSSAAKAQRADSTMPRAPHSIPTIEAITDQVVQQINHRMTAWRERMGKF
jgi:hypothetical protein